MSSNQKIIDTLTRRQIFIQRYSKAESRRLLKHLKRLSAEIKSAAKSSQGMALSVQIARLTQEILEAYGDDLLEGARKFAEDEAEFAGQALVNSTKLESFASPSREQILSAFRDEPMVLLSGNKAQATSINEMVAKFTTNKTARINELIRDATTQGKTLDEVVDAVLDEVAHRTPQQAEALVRTVTNQVGSTARSEVYKANANVLIGEEYVAVLDSRTTIICASLDGTIYPVGEGVHPPAHWGCRSVRVPVVNPKFNLGAKVKGKRASAGGLVDANTTYGGWLKTQPKNVQDEVLGKERAKLFRSGKIKIGNFTDDSGKEYNLDQLKALNPLAFE